MRKRYFYLDVLRIIAILAVVLMHSSSAVARTLSKNTTDFPFIFTTFFNSLTRFAVPLFVMISGSLMINAGKHYKNILRRVGHFLIVFLFWSLVYTLSLHTFEFYDSFTLSFVLDTILTTLKGNFHFWYIFLICGLYLILPFIDILAKNMTTAHIKLFIFLSLFLCFFPPLFSLSSIVNNSIAQNMNLANVGFLSVYCLYFMLGYWLRNYSPSSYKFPVICFTLSAFFTISITIYLSAAQGTMVKSFLDCQMPNVFLMTISLFLIVKKRFQSSTVQQTSHQFCAWLSKLSFGVYLIHQLILETTVALVLNATNNVILATSGLFIATTALSYLITYVLYCIPFLKKIVT